MKRVIIYCEGPTEETFVNRILAPAFYPRNIYITASNCGGDSKYSIIKRDLRNLCKDSGAVVTSMLDYYQLPSDTPGVREATGSVYEKVNYIEEHIRIDVDRENLMPNLMLHEFEALLFSEPECFSYCGLSERKLAELKAIRQMSETPEHIDNGPSTAPSKRILSLYPEYIKPLDGINVAQDIGLDRMRAECRHFDQWVTKLERLEN